ncbi:hypothetical protein CRU86_00155 [Aliarcobacter skirrowii]|uniref:hypothetical protein n=1 Tax=Aliarcobacter skirrowii TaxID=28200 RepID=UPI00100A3366|nr:hypothetical protein [Aliarcobacter skirrowii]RXJ80823.1 hypothetical protein CRU86_00155 [Aliarcobacter skirrowii]
MKAIELYNKFEPAFKLIVQGYNIFDEYQTDKHIRKATRFHRNILNGNESEENIKYEQENIKAMKDDYFTLLKFAIQDEEEEKVDIYTNIYKYIRDNQNLETNLKRFLLKAAKDIPFSAVELLPQIYIHQKYHAKLKNLNDYLQSLYKSNGYETSILENYKFINSGRGSFGPIKYNVLNQYFTPAIDAFFGKEDLLPEKYGIKVWKNKSIFIFSNVNTSSYLLKKIISILEKNSIVYTFGNDATSETYLFSHFISPITDLKNETFNVSDLKSNSKLLKVTCNNIIGRNDILNLEEKEDLEKFEYEINRFSD